MVNKHLFDKMSNVFLNNKNWTNINKDPTTTCNNKIKQIIILQIHRLTVSNRH